MELVEAMLGWQLAPGWLERFLARIDMSADVGCWPWSGGVLNRKRPYGRVYVGHGTKLLVHRVSYLLTVGPIEHELDHTCRFHTCARPSHLDDIEHVMNVRRGEAGLHLAQRTHCPSGHAYTPANTRIARDGSRGCITCHRRSNRERARRRRGITPDQYREYRILDDLA